MVIITGSTGFVGKNLGEYLSTAGIDFLPWARAELKKEYYSKISRGDIIIHLAGKAHDLKKASSPAEYYSINYEVSKELYDAFLNSEASKFIYISSIKALTDHAEKVLEETDIPNPQTYYGKSKLLAEEYMQRQLLPEGKKYYILRPCMIHGPQNKGNLNLLYKFVSKGLPYPLAAFDNRRSFLSIENLCFIFKEFIERHDMPSGIYNVADDDSLSTNEVVSILSESLNRKPSLIRIPKSLIRLAAKFGDVLNLPLNTERLVKLTENYIVSNKKLKQFLKKELPLSTRDGISKTARSFNNV